MFRRLNSVGISRTADQLRQRIFERFPNSGLSKVAAELADITHDADSRTATIIRPVTGLRQGVIVGVFVLALGSVMVAVRLNLRIDGFDFAQFVQILDAAMNIVVIIGGAVVSLITIENRVRRSRALKALHELRALAHVVDMHQLTKDPDRIMGIEPTDSSPEMKLTRFELTRYLNYCSEMLSLIGKLGALYVQDLDDPVALDTANELEDLTTGLSQKMWQKINIVHQSRG